MQPQTLDNRVERLETRVTALEQLPARMDAFELQLSQFRDEVRAEFSATRGETRAGDEMVVRTLREEIRAGDEMVVRTLRTEIREVDERLSTQMRVQHEELSTQMRVLHEEVLSRVALIQESLPRRRKQRQ